MLESEARVSGQVADMFEGAGHISGVVYVLLLRRISFGTWPRYNTLGTERYDSTRNVKRAQHSKKTEKHERYGSQISSSAHCNAVLVKTHLYGKVSPQAFDSPRKPFDHQSEGDGHNYSGYHFRRPDDEASMAHGVGDEAGESVEGSHGLRQALQLHS